MIRYHQLDHRFVAEIPEKLDNGLLYISMQYATAVHLCCCGCGHEVVTPLSPAQWQMTFDGESVSLQPSIGSWSLRCRSHYVIQRGRIIEAGQWSEEEVTLGRAHDKQARTAYYSSAMAPVRGSEHTPSTPERPPRKGWVTKLREWLGGRR
jgi:hypothetical protein